MPCKMSFDKLLKKPGFIHSKGDSAKCQPKYQGLLCGRSRCTWENPESRGKDTRKRFILYVLPSQGTHHHHTPH